MRFRLTLPPGIVHIPGYSGITEKITGTDTITTSTEKVFFGVDGKIKKTYSKEKIPSFKPEPLMSSLNDNLLRLLFHYTIRPNPAEPEKNEPDYLWAMFGSRFLHILNTELDLKRDIPGTDAIVNTAKIIKSTAERHKLHLRCSKKTISRKTFLGIIS